MAPAPIPIRVLVADDDDAMRELLVQVLTDEGYLVSEARDGIELLALLAPGAAAVDVVLADHRMPGASGLSVLARVGRGATWVLMSAFADDQVTAEALHLGAFRVLAKPLVLEELLVTVRAIAAA